MRQRLTSILAIFFLGGLVALGQSLPFNILISLDISIPDSWRRLTTTERDAPSTSVQKKRAQSSENSPLTLSTTVEEKPKAAEANSADLGNKPGQGATLTIARISPSGPSVFGGSAAPFAQVTVLDGTTPVATATANAHGDWSLVTEYKFANTDPKITLRVADASEKSKSASPALADSTPPSTPPTTGEAFADQAPPAAQLLKKFEGVVAAAREEAKQRDAANSAKANGPGSNEAPASQPRDQAQSLASRDSPSSSSQPSMTTTPVPMTFVYNEATLTPEGRDAAHLLLEYLTLKKFASVTLSGHADERGLPDYNMELSRQRLVTIERVLRDGGYQGKLDLLPKGATEPFMGIDRSRYPHEELMQLDRRVELRVAN
jgi:outer membrane protein OmpA-like peptidoglycan-associated protein